MSGLAGREASGAFAGVRAATELRGLPLLDLAIGHIEAHPEAWRQDTYRCATGMCVAGWMCELAGGQWATGPEDSDYADMLVAGPGEEAWASASLDGLLLIEAASRAQLLLGEDVDRRELFGAFNTLADIRRIRDRIAADLAGGAS